MDPYPNKNSKLGTVDSVAFGVFAAKKAAKKIKSLLVNKSSKPPYKGGYSFRNSTKNDKKNYHV